MPDTNETGALDERDRQHLRRCVELAREALEAGDEPFGSILVDGDGAVRFEERNRAASVDVTRHPEFELARWAAANLTPDERRDCTVYTSGEHCPMCSAAHAMAGLGRIVFASSGAQYGGWLREWGVPTTGRLAPLSIGDVAPKVPLTGPDPELTAEIRALHARHRGVDAGG